MDCPLASPLRGYRRSLCACYTVHYPHPGLCCSELGSPTDCVALGHKGLSGRSRRARNRSPAAGTSSAEGWLPVTHQQPQHCAAEPRRQVVEVTGDNAQGLRVPVTFPKVTRAKPQHHSLLPALRAAPCWLSQAWL